LNCAGSKATGKEAVGTGGERQLIDDARIGEGVVGGIEVGKLPEGAMDRVLDLGAEVVQPLVRDAVEQGRGQAEAQRDTLRRSALALRQAVECGPDLRQEPFVAAQQRAQLGVVGIVQQLVEAPGAQPHVAQAVEAAVVQLRQRQRRAVDAAGAGAADHVDARRGAGQLEQAAVDRMGLAHQPVQLERHARPSRPRG
jgi:hypothetical protein